MASSTNQTPSRKLPDLDGLLLVDPDEIYRKLMTLRFSQLGVSIQTAGTADQAEIIIRSSKPPVVLIDSRLGADVSAGWLIS